MENGDVKKVLERQLTLLSERIEETKYTDELCSLCDMVLKTAAVIVGLNPLGL